jgi:hypothetical protein
MELVESSIDKLRHALSIVAKDDALDLLMVDDARLRVMTSKEFDDTQIIMTREGTQIINPWVKTIEFGILDSDTLYRVVDVDEPPSTGNPLTFGSQIA